MMGDQDYRIYPNMLSNRPFHLYCPRNDIVTKKEEVQKTEAMREETSELDTSIEEWKEALGRESRGDPGETVGELSTKLGIPESSLRRKLIKLIVKGKVVVGNSTRGGRKCTVYQLIGEEK